MLLAHLELEGRPRNVFGTPLEESTDPGNQFKYQGRDGPLVDWQVAAVGKKQDAYYKANKDVPRHGHIWTPRD